MHIRDIEHLFIHHNYTEVEENRITFSETPLHFGKLKDRAAEAVI